MWIEQPTYFFPVIEMVCKSSFHFLFLVTLILGWPSLIGIRMASTVVGHALLIYFMLSKDSDFSTRDFCGKRTEKDDHKLQKHKFILHGTRYLISNHLHKTSKFLLVSYIVILFFVAIP